MKNISSRKFVLCKYYNQEIPKEGNAGCCDNYNEITGKCEYVPFRISTRHISKLSDREEVFDQFNQHREDE